MKKIINTAYTIYGIVMLLLCILLARHNIAQQRELGEYYVLQSLWMEKYDTCINRNRRLYNELEELREYKIMKLKEQNKIDQR